MKIFKFLFFIASLGTCLYFTPWKKLSQNKEIYCENFLKIKDSDAFILNKKSNVFFDRTIVLVKKQNPIFLIDENVYTEDLKKIDNFSEEILEKLIKVEGNPPDFLLKSAYKKIKILKNKIKKMEFIDKRRWRIDILKDKIITIDFKCGNPNVEKLIYLEKKFNLFYKFSYIDIRYENKIVAK